MREYYYLKASLPYLTFNKAPLMSGEDFLTEGRKWMDPKDLKMLERTKLEDHVIRDDETRVSFDWKIFNSEFKKEIAAARKKVPGKIPSKRVKRIMKQETPLDSEIMIEKIRWDHLEDKELLFGFDINALIIYFLKLQIAERLASFDKDKGENIFYKSCEVKYGKH
ncbi:MAG: DUF2764 family protein [Candidatus Omnitrophota bacterium]